MALDYVDKIYALAEKLPRNETYNLSSQITRAATSIGLNIAEGSTGQSDPEQGRFLAMATGTLLETIACRHIVQRRHYLKSDDDLVQQFDARTDPCSQTSSNEEETESGRWTIDHRP